MKKHLWIFSLLFFCASFVTAQRTVTGTIIDETGEALIGANVVVKGTTIGTVTDIEGKYSIAVPEGSNALVVSYTGFTTMEKEIGASNILDFNLSEGLALKEVVVVGYGQNSKKLNIQTVGSVGQEGVSKIQATSPQQILQGQVAGVQMTNSSGVLGAASNIRIRGVASLNAGGNPLFVVDGVPLADEDFSAGYGGASLNSLLDIAPSDIESMTVLKDAGAAAIYGSRGSNGVVLITTKKGTAGKNNVVFNTSYGTLQATNLFDMANTEEWVQILGVDAADFPSDYFDWQDAVVQTGYTFDANLGFTGGNATTNYYVGAGYSDAENYTIGNSLNKINARINLRHKLNDRVTAGANVGLTRTNSDRTSVENSTFAPLTSAYLQRPYVLPRNEDGSFANTGFIANVIAIEELGLVDFNSYRAIGNVFAEVKLLEGLTFKTDWGLDFQEVQEEFREVEAFTPGGYAFNDLNRGIKWLTTNTLNYSKILNDDHALNFVVGQSFESLQFSDITVESTGFAADKLRNAGSGATPTTTSATRTAWGLNSYFGRVNYRLMDKYIAEVSLRGDGSSRFGANNRWGVFWAVSGGWIASDEDFLKDNNTLSFLKLRASYGTTGNDRIDNFASLGLAGGGNDYNGQPGLAATQAANPNLKWEETTQFDFGIESTWLKDRIRFNASFYVKNTDGLLLDFQLPYTSGFTNITRNAGSMKNTGVDLELGGTILRTAGGLTWDMDLNVGFLNNEVTSLPDATVDEDGNGFLAGSASQRAVVGQSANEFFLIRYNGINSQTGDAEWLDRDGVPTTTPGGTDRVYVGSAIPDFTGGLSSTLRYKDFDFGLLFNFVSGGNVYIGDLRFTENPLSGFNKSTALLDTWQNPGDESFAPSTESDTYGSFAQRSTSQLFDASYIRLKNITLGYTLKGSKLGTNVFENIRFYIQGNNLLTFNDDAFRGQDIEVSADGQNNLIQGESFFATPQAKIFKFGLNATF